MHVTKTYEIGDFEYEVEMDEFNPGSPGSYWEPADGPEVTACNTVAIIKGICDLGGSNVIGYVTWEVFCLYLAADKRITVDKACDLVIEELCELACEAYSDRFDDGPDDDGWRYED